MLTNANPTRMTLRPQGFWVFSFLFIIVPVILFIFFGYWSLLITTVLTLMLCIFWFVLFKNSLKKSNNEFLGLDNYSNLLHRFPWDNMNKQHKEHLPKLHPNIKFLVSSSGLNPYDINDFADFFEKNIYKKSYFKYLNDEYTIKSFNDKILDKGIYSIPYHFLNHPNILNYVIGLENFTPNKPISQIDLSKVKDALENEEILINVLSSKHCKVYLNSKLNSQVNSSEKAMINKYLNAILNDENIHLKNIKDLMT